MKKLLAFVGESGSGKTTLIAKLMEKYPEQFKKVVTCTNRPKRVGEIDEVDYHFLPTEYFTDNPSLVLTNKTSEGFYYSTRRLDLLSNTHHLLLTLGPLGARKLSNLGLKNIVVVRISISDELKVERMRKRGDSEDMISSRLQSDIESKVDVDLGQIQIIDLDAVHTINENINLVVNRVDG